MKSETVNKIFLAVAAIAALIVFAWVQLAYANPSQFTNTTQTASATTSVTYILPGVATSTLVADTYQSATGNNYVNNTTELLLQFTASSTLSQLNIAFEYSNGYGLNGNGADCVTTPTACDWYQDTFTNVQNFSTTTLPMVSVFNTPVYGFVFASSTIAGQQPAANNNRTTRAISLNVPTRYVRAVFSCNGGGAGCAVWAQFVPAKEVR